MSSSRRNQGTIEVRYACLALLLAFTVVVAGCGDDDGGGSASTGSGPSAGGGGPGNGNTGGGSGNGIAASTYTCTKVKKGKHDGICVSINGSHKSFFARGSDKFTRTLNNLVFNYFPIPAPGVPTNPGAVTLPPFFIVQIPANNGLPATGSTTVHCSNAHAELELSTPNSKGTYTTYIASKKTAGSSCTISYTYNKNTRVVSGTFHGKLKKTFGPGKRSRTVSQGVFRVTLPGGTPPGADSIISAQVNGTTRTTNNMGLAVIQYHPASNQYFSKLWVEGQGGGVIKGTAFTWDLLFSDLPEQTGKVVTTNCSSSLDEIVYKRFKSLKHHTTYVPKTCSITYKKVAEFVLKGTFQAQLKRDPGASKGSTLPANVSVTNGTFKIYLPDGPDAATS